MSPTTGALTVAGVEVATYVDATTVTDPTLSPRPYLHPVRTLGGIPVTDCMPDDHRWHLGVSVAIQDVGGFNFWGGRTYVRDQGYVWREDHGVQRHHSWSERSTDRWRQELGWYAPDGRCLLVEARTLHAAAAARPAWPAGGEHGWVLTLDFQLHNVTGMPLTLGSPATNGRAGAGYGGLFWRLPRSSAPPSVFTAYATGEAAVHGSVAPWLAWTADAGDPARPFTVVLAPTGAGQGRADPWFVRVEGYPGMCSALAFDRAVVLAADGIMARTIRALVVDGSLEAATIVAWLGPWSRH